MSSLRPIDLRLVDELVDFIRGRGYVLDFSDTSFAEFCASELGVDIDDPVYASGGTSKGKRLRAYLSTVDDQSAVQALTALWNHRQTCLARLESGDPVTNSEGRFLTLIERLKGSGQVGVAPQPAQGRRTTQALRDELNGLRDLDPQQRGYSFEKYLGRLFAEYGLAPRQPFRNRGEQIDGSFLLDQEVYLLEAKWTTAPIGVGDLRAFHGKLDKAAWTRGVFVSYGGFTDDGLAAFGRAQRLVCVEGRDLYEALDREVPLTELLRAKIRHAAETGDPFVPFGTLFKRVG